MAQSRGRAEDRGLVALRRGEKAAGGRAGPGAGLRAVSHERGRRDRRQGRRASSREDGRPGRQAGRLYISARSCTGFGRPRPEYDPVDGRRGVRQTLERHRPITVGTLKLEVWKFGGASLADGRAIAAAAERIAAHRGPLVVLASALAGVTDLLLQSTPEAGETFARKHQQAARVLLGNSASYRELARVIDQSAGEYRDICA